MWASRRHHKASDVAKRYFPIEDLWDEDVATIQEQYLFHHNVTDEEWDRLRETIVHYIELLDAVDRDKCATLILPQA